MNHFLSKTGLSITQAQSASNLANQKAQSIKDDLDHWQIIKSSVKLDNKVYVLNHGVQLKNSEVKDKLINIAGLHALQAFLMHNLKARKTMIVDIELREFVFEYEIEAPKRPVHKESIELAREHSFNPLNAKEQAEYLAVEAYAAHIGQFIHKDGYLDKHRRNFHKMMDYEERISGDNTLPVEKEEKVSKGELDMLHEELAKEHRFYNQRLNYFKAKIKNLLNEKNQQIAVQNHNICDYNEAIYEAYKTEHRLYQDKYAIAQSKARHDFDAKVSKDLNQVSQLRITVPEEYKGLLDILIETDDKEKK